MTGGWQSSENIQRHHEVQHELRFISTQYTHYQSVDDILQAAAGCVINKVQDAKPGLHNEFLYEGHLSAHQTQSLSTVGDILYCYKWLKNTSALRSIRYRDIIFHQT